MKQKRIDKKKLAEALIAAEHHLQAATVLIRYAADGIATDDFYEVLSGLKSMLESRATVSTTQTKRKRAKSNS